MLEPDGYYWYRELDDEGRINFNCPCAIHGDFATLLFENGAVGNNFLVVRMDGTLMPLHAPAQPQVPANIAAQVCVLVDYAQMIAAPNGAMMAARIVTQWLDDAQRPGAQPQVPDWSQAPEWAMWWAKDKDGARYFYEVEPSLGKDVWHSSGRYEKEDVPTSNSWRTTLTQRPSLGDDNA